MAAEAGRSPRRPRRRACPCRARDRSARTVQAGRTRSRSISAFRPCRRRTAPTSRVAIGGPSKRVDLALGDDHRPRVRRHRLPAEQDWLAVGFGGRWLGAVDRFAAFRHRQRPVGMLEGEDDRSDGRPREPCTPAARRAAGCGLRAGIRGPGAPVAGTLQRRRPLPFRPLRLAAALGPLHAEPGANPLQRRWQVEDLDRDRHHQVDQVAALAGAEIAPHASLLAVEGAPPGFRPPRLSR